MPDLKFYALMALIIVAAVTLLGGLFSSLVPANFNIGSGSFNLVTILTTGVAIWIGFWILKKKM